MAEKPYVDKNSFEGHNDIFLALICTDFKKNTTCFSFGGQG